MNKVLILMDVSNLYLTISNQFDGAKFDYVKFLEGYRADSNYRVHRAIAYGAYRDQQAHRFINVLREAGYEVRFKEVEQFSDGSSKANWDIEITINAVQIEPFDDVVVLCSSDGDFVPLVNYIKSKGKRCFVLGARISEKLRQAADSFTEITEDHLERR